MKWDVAPHDGRSSDEMELAFHSPIKSIAERSAHIRLAELPSAR